MMNNYQAPHLATTMIDPLHLIERQLLDQCSMIEDWFSAQWRLTPAPLYGSVDLRNSGFKLAPVDMNLFPAGFNNLNPGFFQLSVEAAQITINESAPSTKKILLIPEDHSRNPFYWENVNAIAKILSTAGFEVRVGTLSSALNQPHPVTLMSGEDLLVEPLVRSGDLIKVENFIPDVIMLNNDLSNGIPDLLTHLSIPILPPAQLGWSQRSKAHHFQHYQQVVNEFATFIRVEPWFMASYFRHCDGIDFMQRKGEENVINSGEALFADIQKKYDEFKINVKPFLVMKADAGTYGMAIMTIRNVDELRNLNRKQRTKMSVTKGGRPVNSIILQEGVYTFETWGAESAVAEPVVYLWGQRVTGGFYRVHKERGIDENLNSPGMHFEPLPFVKTCNEPICDGHLDKCENRFYAYGVIARLSMVAAAREMMEVISRKILPCPLN
jgi:glutamate--cysteine ligase